jgi:membrane protease YdiL (CAAX protease family)
MRIFPFDGTTLPAAASPRQPGLPIFLGTAFSLSWLLVGLIVRIGGRNALPPAAIVSIFIFGPLLAAIGASAYAEGWAGVRDLLAQWVRWRVALRWYAIALGIPALIVVAAALLFLALGGPVPPALPGSIWPAVPLMLIGFVVGGLLEETGWRGYALPRLQSRVGALWASIILGAIHACWHLPLFFIAGAGFDTIAFPVYVVITIALSVLFTWIYNSTGHSLLLVSIAHASVNVWMANVWGRAVASLPSTAHAPNPAILYAVALMVAAILLALRTDRQTLTGGGGGEAAERS